MSGQTDPFFLLIIVIIITTIIIVIYRISDENIDAKWFRAFIGQGGSGLDVIDDFPVKHIATMIHELLECYFDERQRNG